MQGALQQLGVEAVVVAAGYGVSKVMFKVGGMLYPTAQAAITRVMAHSPVAQSLASSLENAIVASSKKLSQTAVGRRALLIKSSVNNLETRLLNAQNKLMQKVGFGWKKVTGQQVPKPGLSNNLTNESKVGAHFVFDNNSNLSSKEIAKQIAKRAPEILENTKPALESLVRNGNKIKKVSDTAVRVSHTFLADHVKRGISKIGNSVENVLDASISLIKKADNLNLLQEGTNVIRTYVNDIPFEVRVHLQGNTMRSFNTFAGHSAREFKNLITFK